MVGSGRAGGGSVRADAACGFDEDIAEQFRAVLDVEERRLAGISRAADFIGWRSRVVREVMDRRSPYALVLRRGHGASRQHEFLQSWQLLIAQTLERVAAGGPPDDGRREAPVAVGGVEDQATAILAALHGGATLSWLADDVRSLEAALDIALAPVLSAGQPRRSGDQPPE